MHYGFVIPWADADEVGDLAAAAEESGWDGIFVWEPVWGVDAWVSLALAAVRTNRIRLGTLLTPPSRRRPAELASQVATVDRLSNGRVVLSVGLGAVDSGFEAFGEVCDRHTRAALMDECLDVVTGLWAGQPFSYHGAHYRIAPTTFPTIGHTVQQPRVPIWCVGAINRPRTMERALRWDGILPQVLVDGAGEHVSLDDVAALREQVGDRPYDIVIEGAESEHAPAAWAAAGATWWIESLWHTMGRPEPVLAAFDRLGDGPPPGSFPAMAAWNFADVFEAVARRQPDAPAQRHAGVTTPWVEFDRRADGVAAALLAAGVVEQDKVAQYLYNAPEYLESTFAAFKAGLATVNTNYRYTADELVYLWDNADVVAVVFHGSFAHRVEDVRDRVPRVRTWLWVDDGSGPCPEWATPYEAAATSSPAATVVAPWGRSGDHLLLLYTGGTTGAPKGVMWRQEDLFGALDAANKARLPPTQDLAAAAARITKPGPRNLPAAPLMHGTGLFNALSNLMVGGSIVTMTGRRFDPVELLDTVADERINSMSIVGDAFAKPILRALDGAPERWDISSLRVIVSSGVIWSAETKAGLLRHNERLIMVDSLGSSEAIGMASSTVTADGGADTATFRLGPSTRVVTDDGRDVVPGSGEHGLVAIRGHTPIGYYKDPVKSAGTFRVIDGARYSIPGDLATVDADGTVRLLGRGSQCINTGGEKVYPEEVEEVLKLHPTVADAAVVGLPDERFGEAVTALVEPHAGDTVSEAVLIAHVKERLAGYKAPKRIFEVPTIGRAANGKLDYRALKEHAAQRSAG